MKIIDYLQKSKVEVVGNGGSFFTIPKSHFDNAIFFHWGKNGVSMCIRSGFFTVFRADTFCLWTIYGTINSCKSSD